MNLKVFKILATGIVSMLLNVAVAQQSMERSGSNLSLSLETANRKALQKLTTILTNDQYPLYLEMDF